MNRIDAPIRAQDAKAGPEALFGMRPVASTATISPSVLGPILPAHRRN